LLDSLKPVSNNNSLRQVVATIFSPGNLVNPKRFKQYLGVLNCQKFEILTQRIFTIGGNQNLTNENQNSSKEIGYRMIGYNDGRIKKVIHTEEKKLAHKDMVVMNFQSLDYPGWDNFVKEVLNDFFEVSKEDNPFIQAISLNYVNEFVWASNEMIPIDEIFDRNADFMSNKFFNSQNTSFSINTEEYKQSYKAIEQLDINVSGLNKMIQIKSQVVFELSQSMKLNDSIENGSLKEHFETIHTEIKKNLNSLFTQEVKRKINLT